MQKLKILVIVCLLLTFVATPQINAGQVNQEDYFVSKEDAKNICENFVAQSNLDWLKGDIEFRSNLHDLNDNILGYYYSVGDGYIIVAATKELSPILQFGEKNISDEVDKNISKGNYIYYLGALDYEFGKNANEVKNKLKSKNKPLQLMLQKNEYLYNDAWDRLKNIESLNNNINNISLSNERILNVQRIYQRSSGINNPDSACGPTTGAMITNYYKQLGYNVNDSSYYGGDAALVNHLYSEMQTLIGGTTATGYGSGLENHLDHNYHNQWNYQLFNGNGNWNAYYHSIEKNRPVGLRFGLNTNPDVYTSWHFVAGIGYYFDMEVPFAVIKDPDNGPNNTGNHYISWYVNAPYMQIIPVYYGSW